MKRLAFVSTAFPSKDKSWYCNYLYQQLCELKKLDWDIDVYIPDANLQNGVLQKASYPPFRTYHIGFNRSKRLKFVTAGKFRKRFENCLQSGKYDMVAFHLGLTEIKCQVVRAANRFHIPMVLHLHGLNFWKDYFPSKNFLRKIYSQIENVEKRYLLRRLRGVVGVSDKVCATVSDSIKTYKVYNGADNTIFYPSNEPKDDGTFVITCVANLIPIKGQKYLIEAIREIKDKTDKKIQVNIIGNGSDWKFLHEITNEYGLQEEIVFLGELLYDKVAEMMRKSDFFVLPSFYEALGCVYLEAMASGVAVMVTTECGMCEIINSGETGYIVEPRNSAQIAEAILKAINDPKFHKAIAKRGYELVQNNFLWSHSAMALNRAYEKVMEESR